MTELIACTACERRSTQSPRNMRRACANRPDVRAGVAISGYCRIVPQSSLCGVGRHYWTTWGNYVPVYPHPTTASFVDPGPVEPTYEPIEAYRWRYCQCGAAEREDHRDNSRKVFDRDPNPLQPQLRMCDRCARPVPIGMNCPSCVT